MAWEAETGPYFQRHERLKWGFWVDHRIHGEGLAYGVALG